MARPFSVIDAETAPFEHGNQDLDPFLWGMYDERGFQTFQDTESLCKAMEKEDRIFYAHNGGKFDFHFLLDKLNTYEEITVIHGRIAKARIGRAELRDSYCLLPDKLDNLTSGSKIKIDYNKFRRELRNEYMAEIVKYLEADCFLLYEKLEEFFKEHPAKPLTLASAAMAWWTKHCNSGQRVTMGSIETQERYYKDLNPWYFGGRVEVIQPGYHANKIETFDLNSAYPRAMMDEHPAGPARFGVKNVEKDMERKLYLIQAKSTGFFPIRKRSGGIFFPRDGEIRQFNVTGWELKAALELGLKIDKMLEVWEFPHTRSFKNYVNHFWAIKNRAEKGSFERLHAKLMLNSLYGKFGANPENYSRNWLVDFDDADAFACDVEGQISGVVSGRALVSAALLPSQRRYFDVVTALSITGHVRATLMKAIFQNNALYCDTDCVHVRGQFAGIVGKELGQWQKEFLACEAAYAGPKLYALRDRDGFQKFGSKGVALPDGKEFETIKGLCQGGTYTYDRQAPTFSLTNGRSYQTRKVRRTS